MKLVQYSSPCPDEASRRLTVWEGLTITISCTSLADEILSELSELNYNGIRVF